MLVSINRTTHCPMGWKSVM